MSWQNYVDEQLIATKAVSGAAIVSHTGTIWAASAGFSVTEEEMRRLATTFTSRDTLAMGGIHVAGTKYMFLSSTDNIIRGKKGPGGIHIVKTSQALIVSVYSHPTTPEQCAVVTERLGDYLLKMGF